jgi:hypothetical protein
MVSVSALVQAVFCVAGVVVCSGLLIDSSRRHEIPTKGTETLSRREIFSGIISGLAMTTIGGPAVAFENKISTKYDDRPKRRGPKVCVFPSKVQPENQPVC